MSSILTRDGKFLRTTDGKGLNFDSLITQANAKTGANDKTLGAAVQRLVDGYGTGGILPEGFQEVEWIGSNGSQWINTEWSAHEYTFYLKYQFTTLPTDLRYVFGRYVNSVRLNFLRASSSNVLSFGMGSHAKATSITPDLDTHEVWIDCVNYTYKHDSITGSITQSSLSSSANLYLFCGNVSGSPQHGPKVNIYRFSILSGAIKVLDMVPFYMTKTPSIIGMYDIIGRKMYLNSGTGTFTKGPDVISPTDFMNNLEAIL